MKKFFITAGLLLVLLVAGGFYYVHRLKHAALPDYNATMVLEGLVDEVEVFRDARGIPHIYAHNEHDLYLVSGYVTAQDRLWQMDLLRRVTQGRLAEIFGEELVETDVLLRKLEIPESSIKLLKKLDRQLTEPLEAFARGVNLYIEAHKDNLPFEFQLLGYKPEPWKPEHSLNLVGYMAWNLEMGYKMEGVFNAIRSKVGEDRFREVLPHFDTQTEFVYDAFPQVRIDTVLEVALNRLKALQPEIFTGSNNWVVSGKKSTTGKPIFSNDMHLGLNIPGIWSRMHQVIEGQLNVTGVILPGSPFIVAGHNDYIAWGMTNVMLDGADFYVETLSDDGKSYRFNGAWRKLRTKEEKIRVKGRDQPVIRTLYFTHRGPVLTDKESKSDKPAVSMRWIGNEESYEIRTLYRVNRAKNWKEFKAAFEGFKSVSQNVAYADIYGNIGIQMTGRIPVRKAPGYLFLPGETDEYDWQGFVPYDSLPYEWNPERGFVSSANNRSIDPGKFGFYISEWYDLPYRIKRIRQMLTEKEQLSPDDFKRMLYDHHSVQADEMLPVYLKYLEKLKNLNPDEQKALHLLKNWNGSYDTESAAPVIFEQMYMFLVDNIAADELGDTLTRRFKELTMMSEYLISRIFHNEQSVWCDDIKTGDKNETFADILEKTFRQTVAHLTKNYGALDRLKWGDVHRLKLQHPLGKMNILDRLFGLNRTFRAPGNNNTVNPFSYTPSKYFESDFGASQKHIFNTADWDASYSILPTGISGIPASVFYCDQAEDYVDGKIYRDYFSREQVERNAKYKGKFVPSEREGANK